MEMLNGVQFDQERLDRARAIPVEERRLRNYTARKEAAKKNATQWSIAVDHSSHEDLQRGITSRQQSHVILSREEHPDPMEAEQTAYLWGQARGTYPTRVRYV